jgi:NAD-dependent DNA ligase
MTEKIEKLNIPDQALVHRYLYYVLDNPVISDYDYDMLEKAARKLVNESHPINSPGSSLRQSYPDYIIKFVEE